MLYHIGVECVEVLFKNISWSNYCNAPFTYPKALKSFGLRKKMQVKPHPSNVLLNSGKLVPRTPKSWAKFWWLSAVMLMQLMVLSSETQMELLSLLVPKTLGRVCSWLGSIVLKRWSCCCSKTRGLEGSSGRRLKDSTGLHQWLMLHSLEVKTIATLQETSKPLLMTSQFPSNIFSCQIGSWSGRKEKLIEWASPKHSSPAFDFVNLYLFNFLSTRIWFVKLIQNWEAALFIIYIVCKYEQEWSMQPKES